MWLWPLLLLAVASYGSFDFGEQRVSIFLNMEKIKAVPESKKKYTNGEKSISTLTSKHDFIKKKTKTDNREINMIPRVRL